MTVCMTALESAEERRLFEDVYRACCGRMLALARRRLSAQTDAEDAVQQSFLALAERFSRLAKLPETQLEAYLVVTVERKCIDILRQQARRDGVPFDENTVLVTPPPCGDPVADAMGRLPPAAARRCCCAMAAATAPVRRRPCWSCPLPRPRSFCSGLRPRCVQNWKRRAYLYEHSAQ